MNKAARIEPASKARLRLWLRLLKATRAVEGRVRERLRDEHGSTLPRFDVMAALHREPAGLRMSALSSELRVSNGNVTGIVDRLVAEGAVERRAVEGDRRAMVVRLTEAGAAAFEAMAAEHERWIDEMLGAVGADEAEALSARLGELAEGAEWRR
ncbi:MAG: MarR family transcriptional regulator [Pseudomonadota bacterium]